MESNALKYLLAAIVMMALVSTPTIGSAAVSGASGERPVEGPGIP